MSTNNMAMTTRSRAMRSSGRSPGRSPGRRHSAKRTPTRRTRVSPDLQKKINQIVDAPRPPGVTKDEDIHDKSIEVAEVILEKKGLTRAQKAARIGVAALAVATVMYGGLKYAGHDGFGYVAAIDGVGTSIGNFGSTVKNWWSPAAANGSASATGASAPLPAPTEADKLKAAQNQLPVASERTEEKAADAIANGDPNTAADAGASSAVAGAAANVMGTPVAEQKAERAGEVAKEAKQATEGNPAGGGRRRTRRRRRH